MRGAPRSRTCGASAGRGLPAELQCREGLEALPEPWAAGGQAGRGGEAHGGDFFLCVFSPRDRLCPFLAEPAARRGCRSRAAATPSFVCFGSGIVCALPPPAAPRPRQLPPGFAPLPSPPREVPRSPLLPPKFGFSSALLEEKWWCAERWEGEARGRQGGCTLPSV